uniref:G-protein coupled receptors family 2 profile 2 domain-containing protein n=1 Tax=Strigamia maritima TaxID=126957 RepID=T1ISF6_STRMM
MLSSTHHQQLCSRNTNIPNHHFNCRMASGDRESSTITFSFVNATTNAGLTVANSNVVEEEVFSLVTVVANSLSLVGLIFAFITYSLFSDVRSLAGTTLMNLLAALFLLQLLFVVGVQKLRDNHLCLGLVFSLHGLGLSVFTWLTAMTHDVYVMSKDSNLCVRDNTSARMCTFCRYSIIAWGFPCACTCLAVALQDFSMPPDNCWISRTEILTYAFALPLAFITVVMAFFATRAAITIKCVSDMLIDRKRSRKWRNRRYVQLSLYVKIYALSAAVWLCGLGARMTGIQTVWMVFQLLFSVQGLLVAVAYTCNGRMLKIYSSTFRPRTDTQVSCYGTAGDLSCSTSLQLLTWETPPDAV